VKDITIPIEIDELAEEQSKDDYIQRIWRISLNKQFHDERISMQDREDALNLKKLAGIIVKAVKRVTGEIRARVVVPESLQRRVVEEAHRASHAGVTGTYHTLQQDHWFRGMKRVVKDVVRHCPECIAVKGRPLTPEKMAPDERPLALGDRWHIDGLKLDLSHDYDHLFVATDAATKYVVLLRSKGETAESAKEILMDITTRFGRPREVTTDRGKAYMCKLFMDACRALSINFKPVAVKQPQANGAVERVNQVLISMASILCKGKGEDWSLYVKEMEYGINTRVHSATRFTPYELVYGRLPPGPVYIDPIREEERNQGAESESVKALRTRINLLQQLAHLNQTHAAESQETYHDRFAGKHTFKENDIVWLYKQSDVSGGVTSKLKYHWRGPYTIEKVIGPVTFTLKDANGKKLPGTHHARQLYKVDD